MPIPKDILKAQLWKDRQRNAQEGKSRNKGIENPFYGKKHSKKQKQLWSQQRKGKKKNDPRINYLPDTINESKLIALYPDHSIQKLSEIFKTTEWYIDKATKIFGISRRSRSEILKLANQKRTCKGKTVSSEGYVYVLKKEHCRANKKGYVPEHLLVWENFNRKKLPKNYVIHHLNGIKDDNRPENLVGLPRRKHHYALYLQELQKRIKELEAQLNAKNKN